MEDAWAHGGEEGRGKLRKARGSGTHALIPRWPNGETRRVATSVIWSQDRKRTQGTETSQYLEEEKSIEMPGVAASETGPRAQTSLLVGLGLKDPRTHGTKAAEVPWNGAPETVTAR